MNGGVKEFHLVAAGTTAHEWTGAPLAAASHAAHNPSNDVEVQAKKPGMGGMHMEH